VNLVLDQMMQLHHVHHADGDRLLELKTGTAVIKRGLSALRQSRALKQLEDLVFPCAVENR
jgi:hypothetical protein